MSSEQKEFNSFLNSVEIEDLCESFRNKMEDLNMENLKERCKVNNITKYAKLNKKDIIQLLVDEYNCIYDKIKDQKIDELKNICKTNNIKGYTGLNKKNIIKIIMDHLSLKECISLIKVPDSPIKVPDSPIKVPDSPIKEPDLPKKKQPIPKSVKTIVWDHYIGKHINSHRCLCCKKVLIEITNFDVGHVISEKDGGTLEINNLRPICAACNHSMGAMNMIEFVKKYGLYIG